MIQGFSKFTKEQKRAWLIENYFSENQEDAVFETYDIADVTLQKLHDDFIENAIANYMLPMGIAPNFCINQKLYSVPMVIEESSVVAGVSKSAKFWAERGGFHSQVIFTEKVGQVHFFFSEKKEGLEVFFQKIKPILFSETEYLTANMQKRGGGIKKIELRDKTDVLEGYFQIHATFETSDAMGANFINSCLEQFAKTIEREAITEGISLEILMSILSNYVPECLVKVEGICPVEKMNFDGMNGREFSERLVKSVAVANAEVHRAVTHNKGVMNGIDAVVIATGNDFRAIEAGVHAYACKSGSYKSLTFTFIEGENLHFGIEIPLALGTVGGLTKLHPMVKMALQILGNPSATELMQITASVGLAQNFAALASLITSGIQKGHMKMHLINILNQFSATEKQKELALTYFNDKMISFAEVEKFLLSIQK